MDIAIVPTVPPGFHSSISRISYQLYKLAFFYNMCRSRELSAVWPVLLLDIRTPYARKSGFSFRVETAEESRC